MEHLVKELNVLLKLLEQEHVSSATTEKMSVIRNLLGQLKPSAYVDRGTGSDLIYMNTSLYGNGTSFVESLFEEFDCDLKELRDSPEELKKQEEEETLKHLPTKSSPTDTPPPLPTTPPPEDYYEEAVPLEADTTPQYITTHRNPSPVEDEDAYYEDADKNYPLTRINGPSYNDSDALSSSYESYDEEDDDTKIRDRTSPAGPVKDCRKFAFLLRKKRFGQWAKQLTVIRENRLQCFKNPKDRTPHTDLPLNLCSVVYVCKDGRRKRHELKFSVPGGESLVLAVQSKEQAESWLKAGDISLPAQTCSDYIHQKREDFITKEIIGILKMPHPSVAMNKFGRALRAIQEVNNVANGNTGKENSLSPMIQRKTELEKTMLTDKHTSDSDSVANGDCSRESGENGKGKKGAFSELTGSMSRAAGRKINRIISFSKKKPPLPGDTSNLSHNDDNPRCGYLNVLVNQCWKERWCCVRSGTLYFHKDRADMHTHVRAVVLQGVEVLPGLGPRHPFAFRIMRDGSEVAALEASCSEEMGRWLGLLLAEAGCATTPEALHYDYVDVDTISSIKSAARHSFLWATSSSSASTDSRTYDEVPYESVQAEEAQPKPGPQVQHHSSFSSTEGVKSTSEITVKRQNSSVNQYGKYGKTRAEEDARRYLNEKEQLEKEKEEIRKKLVSLRKEKREVKEQLKDATANSNQQKHLEKRLAQLEEGCRGKEAERVDLELRLTEVKEKLKKSVASRELGAAAENKPVKKVYIRKVEPTYTESIPVNCAAEMRKRPPSICASTRGNVIQKAKEWESKKGT